MEYRDDSKTSQKVSKGPEECFPQKLPCKGLWGSHERLLDPIAESQLGNPIAPPVSLTDRAGSLELEEQDLALTWLVKAEHLC